MAGIDTSRVFLPVNIAVLTISDTRTEANDTSGDALAERIVAAGHRLVARALERDDTNRIEARLRAWIADPAIDVVITSGGTGITGRDVTPEVFERLLEKKIEGFGELFRMLSYAKIGTSTMQSRALGRRRRRHLSLRAARQHRRGQGCLGRYPRLPARRPLPALQPRRAHATADGAPERRRRLKGRIESQGLCPCTPAKAEPLRSITAAQ